MNRRAGYCVGRIMGRENQVDLQVVTHMDLAPNEGGGHLCHTAWGPLQHGGNAGVDRYSPIEPKSPGARVKH